jgi:AbrB family looped-hinge helix DNA binding protein
METAPTTKLTTKGQITVPKATRDFLNIGPGDRVKFFVHPEGHVAMLPATSITKLRGIVKKMGKPVTLKQMDEGITRAILERDRRSRSGR